LNTTDLVARILIRTADDLDRHATTTHPLGHQIPQCMTHGSLDISVSRATEAVLRQTRARGTDRAATVDAARAVLLPVTGTVADYATRLRALAA